MSRVISRHAVRDSFLGRNGLTLAFLALMLLSMLGHALTGWRFDNQERREHGQAAESLGEYVTGEDFLSTLFENWESEFLQMGAYGLLVDRVNVPWELGQSFLEPGLFVYSNQSFPRLAVLIDD